MRILASLLIWFVALQSFAASVYIRDGASGAGTSWSDALDALPSTLTRGDTYYIADGTYGGYTFDDATSGTTLITIKKATVSDHGTSTGWSDTYGDGQAIFGDLTFQTNYFVFDGNTPGGYGFAINSSTTTRAILLGPYGGRVANNITLRSISIDLNTAPTTIPTGRGIYAVKSQDIYIDTVEIKNILNDPFFFDRCNNITVTNCYIHDRKFVTSGSSEHGDIVESLSTTNLLWINNVSSWNGQGLFFNNRSTSTIDQSLNVNWTVVGNVFTAPGTGSAAKAMNGVTSSASQGPGGCSNLLFLNNTVYNIKSSVFSNAGNMDGGATNNIFYNVVLGSFYDSAHDYNYFDTALGSSYSEANAQTGGDPFVNAAGGDWTLSTGTTAGSLTTGYTIDRFGDTRNADGTLDRGAYEFDDGGGSGTPKVSVTASDSTATESGTTTGQFSVSVNPTAALTVNFTVSGDVASGDYSLSTPTSGASISGTHPTYTLTVPTATGTVLITVTPADDADPEPSEVLTLTIDTGSGYTPNAPTSANVTIADDDTSPIQVATPSTSIGSTHAWPTLEITLTDNHGAATLHYTTDGTLVTTNSTTYSAPYTLTKGRYTNYVIASKSGLIASEIVTNIVEVNDFASSAAWGNVLLTEQTGSFTWSFDATPSTSTIDGVVALGLITGVEAFADGACLVRFGTGGTVDARDGSAYAAENSFSYIGGGTYNVLVQGSVSAHTYTVDVRTNGSGSYTRIGTDYDFRTEQAAATELSVLAWIAEVGSLDVENVSFSGLNIVTNNASGARVAGFRGLGMSVLPPPVSPYLLEQDFEGTGYDNAQTWSEQGSATLNEDYTSTVLVGSQSMLIDLTSNIGDIASPVITMPPGGGDIWYVYFQLRVLTFPSSGFRVATVTNSFDLSINASSNLVIRPQVGTGVATVGQLEAGVTYHVWMQGSGDNIETASQGTARVGFSTTGIRPTSGDNYAIDTDAAANGPYSAVQLILGSRQISANYSVIIDKVRVSNELIGDSPQ